MLAQNQQRWLFAAFRHQSCLAGVVLISFCAGSSSCCMMPDYHQPGGFSSTYYKALQYHQQSTLAASGHATVVPGTPPPGMQLPVDSQSNVPLPAGNMPKETLADPSMAQAPHYGATPKSGYNFGFSWPDFAPPQPPQGHDTATRQKSYLQFTQPPQDANSSTSNKRKKS